MPWTRKQELGKAFSRAFNLRVYPDIMVDIETLGTKQNAVVLSIGAVRFRMGVQDDVDTIMDGDRNFYARLDTDEQELRGRTTDEDTLAWWKRRSSQARNVLTETGEPVQSVLARFTIFCADAKRMWGNGNMFDNAIIRSLYDDYNQDYPIPYWRDLDMRTLTWLWNFITDWRSKGKLPKVDLGTKHTADDDARRQALIVQQMLIELKGSKYES